MKRFLKILTLVLVILLVTTSAYAKAGKGNPKGVVDEFDPDAGTITLITKDGPLLVFAPEGFDFDSLAEGDTLLAKGNWTEEGFEADSIKEVVGDEEDSEDPDDDDGEGNAWGEGGVYCNGGKDKPHPVAAKIAKDYDVDAEWVMSFACEGHGFGGVMLALQTQQATGDDPEETLDKRKNGTGWGQIWKEAGLVGAGNADTPPPGLLKKPDKQTGPPEGKGPDKDNFGPNENSNGKGPDKDKETEESVGEDAEGD